MYVKMVSGYIDLPDNPRTYDEYFDLAARLWSVPGPKEFFANDVVADTWLWKFLKTITAVPAVYYADNPRKDTREYMCVQHQKTEWLCRAAATDPEADVFVWIDCGIMHQPGIDENTVREFIDRIDERDTIVVPGCWDKGGMIGPGVCWRFCGSVLIVPRQWVVPFHNACKDAARKFIIETKLIDWEVNTWARVELTNPEIPIRWYKADHNLTMLKKYRPTEN